ncbi:MAG: phosphoadenylyl-sulfate reductase [Aggregatilineales bacterium]
MNNTFPDQNEFTAIAERYESSSPQDILSWATRTYGDQLALVTSFQPTGIVTLHMLQQIAPDLPVLTLDTGLLFQETYSLIDQLQAQFNLNLHRIRPQQTVEQQAQAHGEALWSRDPDLCCNLRKTRPLDDALTNYSAWITGLRRDQSPTRANTPVIQWDKKHGLAKLCPFATWTESMIWTYIEAYDLPYNTLHDNNYPTIGCFPCTQPVSDGADPRAGRWVQSSKTECGIHLPDSEELQN